MKAFKNGQFFPNIYSYLLSSIGLVLFLSLSLLTASALSILFTRNQNNINNILDRSLAVAWQEYDLFYEKASALLIPLASLTDEQTIESNQDTEYISRLLQAQKEIDFWFIVDSAGRSFSSNGQQFELPEQLAQPVYESWKQKNVVMSSEIISLAQLERLNPALMKKALVEVKEASGQSMHYFAPILVQVTVIPVDERQRGGQKAIVAGHILNNDHTIAERYSAKIPSSYLSISIGGIRISANIETPSGANFIGRTQSKELLKAIQEGKRYLGEAKLEPHEIHFVASEPIRDSKGNIIGALSVGVPSQGLANLKRDTLSAIFISAFISLCVTLGVASFTAKKVTTPLVILSHWAKEISYIETITSDHIHQLESQPAARVRELWYLQRCFTRMAQTLYQKCQENQAYLEELERDRQELQRLTAELQQVNLSLEKRLKNRP